MTKLRALLAVGLLGAALSACGDFQAAVTAPEVARYNGSGFGSGNFVQDSTGSTAATASGEAAAADSVTTLRNGSGFGSGN